jgi:hypothetical protein
MSRGPRVRRAARTALWFALACAIGAWTPATVHAERTLALSSGTFDLNLAAGATGSGEVVVINDGTEPITVFVYSADQKIDAKGNVTYSVPNRDTPQVGYDPAAWMRIAMPESAKAIGNTPYIELKPKQRIPVKFQIQVPEGVASGDHNLLLFFEMFDRSAVAAGATARVSGRLGARVRVRVKGGVDERVEVRPFATPRYTVSQKVPFAFTIINSGNIDERAAAAVVLLDRDEREIARTDVVSDTVIFANSQREETGTVDVAGPVLGAHTMRLEVAYVPVEKNPATAVQKRVVKNRDVWMAPLWVLVAVGALIALAVLGVVWRVARRSGASHVGEEAEAPPQAPPSREDLEARLPEV